MYMLNETLLCLRLLWHVTMHTMVTGVFQVYASKLMNSSELVNCSNYYNRGYMHSLMNINDDTVMDNTYIYIYIYI